MKYAAALFLALALVGCQRGAYRKNLEDAKAYDAANAKPEYVMTLPDGQEMSRIRITAVPPECERCTGLGHGHWVYFVGQVKTENHTMPSGKSSHNEVQVTVQPNPEPKLEPEMSLREYQERKELDYLKAKYEATK